MVQACTDECIALVREPVGAEIDRVFVVHSPPSTVCKESRSGMGAGRDTPS
jgi:hypothetical protein